MERAAQRLAVAALVAFKVVEEWSEISVRLKP